MQDRMRLPVVSALCNVASLKEVFIDFEYFLQRAQKQRLSEPARTRAEVVRGTRPDEIEGKLGLIDIYLPLCQNLMYILNTSRNSFVAFNSRVC